MMNELKGVMNFDQVVSEVDFDGEYYTAYIYMWFGSYEADQDKYEARAKSRNRYKALAYALEDISKQMQAVNHRK